MGDATGQMSKYSFIGLKVHYRIFKLSLDIIIFFHFVFQISEDNFDHTKSSQNQDVESLRSEINARFQIIWNQVQWEELRKSFYSALAARLLLSTFPEKPPNNAEVDAQAAYWKQYYDTPRGPGTEEGFISDVQELQDSESKTC